jgi:hypothetical protein
MNELVIPGRAEGASPGSITAKATATMGDDCDYGFRIAAEPVIGPATSGRTRWRLPE